MIATGAADFLNLRGGGDVADGGGGVDMSLTITGRSSSDIRTTFGEVGGNSYLAFYVARSARRQNPPSNRKTSGAPGFSM